MPSFTQTELNIHHWVLKKEVAVAQGVCATRHLSCRCYAMHEQREESMERNRETKCDECDGSVYTVCIRIRMY